MKIDWKKILDHPTDIFDQSKIKEKVQLLPPSTKAKIFKCLNSIYHKNYQDIFPKFDVSYTPLAPRELPPLRTVDLFEVIELLFATRKKAFVHIGIDFYLIFQSGQRSESDR